MKSMLSMEVNSLRIFVCRS